MEWKKYSLKTALIAYSMIAGCLVATPDRGVCAEQPDAEKSARIESIVASGDGFAAELTIKLTSPATYTSYKTISPLRFVIDFSQVTQGKISSPVIINKGNFKTVTVHRFDTAAGVLTRVEIELVRDSEPVISVLPGAPRELKISFPSLAAASSAVAKKTIVDKPINVVHPPVSTSISEPAPATGIQHRTLTSISVNKNVITLALDGPISNFNTFRLNKPERYVVDLMNVRSGLSTRLLPLNVSGVASARVGLYPDKVRVVLDSVNGSFPEATTAKADTGVEITLGAKPAEVKYTAEQAAVKPEVKPVVPYNQPLKDVNRSEQLSGVSLIRMVDFQVINGTSRVSVKVDGNISVEGPVKTPGYVTLTIKNSTLPKNLQRSLETRSFVSPLLRITPFAVKNKKGTDTKIRIVTRVAAPFEYRQEGDMIYIDFKHPEGLASNKLFIETADQKKKLPKKSVPDHIDEISSDISRSTNSPGIQQEGPTYEGRKVTLEFADAEVRKIFQLLAEVSGKNFVLGDDVTGNISLKLVNVPWDQALDIILDAKGFDKREDGNIIIIKGKGKFGSQESADAENKKNIEKNMPLQPAKVFSVNYAALADVVSQMEKISSGPKGSNIRTDSSVISDARTNKIIVVDTLDRIRQMQDLLSEIDLPEKQVMIEARIVEATSTFSQNLGVAWGVHLRDGAASFLGINSLDTSFGGLTSAAPTSGISSSAGGTMGISFGTLASTVKIDMRLNAAASAGLIKIVSTPKVATLNNKTAKITQGQQIPYTTSTSDKVETKFIEAALSLEVTPHINANGTISMKIDAKNDSPGTGNPPAINKKEATTEMLLRDGETTVIGGIYVDSDQESDDGVPYLMDIPFLGNLFKTNTKSKTKTELLIFITPRILVSI